MVSNSTSMCDRNSASCILETNIGDLLSLHCHSLKWFLLRAIGSRGRLSTLASVALMVMGCHALPWRETRHSQLLCSRGGSSQMGCAWWLTSSSAHCARRRRLGGSERRGKINSDITSQGVTATRANDLTQCANKILLILETTEVLFYLYEYDS